MVQYHRYMCPIGYHIFDPMTEEASSPKGRKILRNGTLENSFKELQRMVSSETLLIYPDWKIPVTVYNDAYDKQLGTVISHTNKPIVFFSRRLSTLQCYYTTNKKELLLIVEYIKQSRRIIFGYKINVFSDHKRMVYAANLSEPLRVMHWRLIL